MAKRWITNPPGEAQKYLNNLFKTGQVERDAKPSDIKKRHKIFDDYSTPAFRQHFEKTKSEYGLSLSANIKNDDGYDMDQGPSGEPAEKKPKFEHKNIETGITHFNRSIMQCVFKDPTSNANRLFIAIPIIFGAQNFLFSVSDDGKHGKFSYDWPILMYDVKKLFKFELNSGMLEYHPQILSYNYELENVRNTINETPRNTILIDFPIEVQKEDDTVMISVQNDEDSDGKIIGKVVKIVLKGFKTAYLENTSKFIKIE